MIKKIITFIFTIIITMNFTAYSVGREKRFEAEFITLFDTVTQIVGYSESKEVFAKHARLIHDELRQYHELYDIYNNYEGINNIKTINDNAGKMPVKVDKKIIDLLLFANEMYNKTNGKLNIALGSVLRIWHDYREQGIEDFENAKLPPADKLIEASKHTDINKLIINEKNHTVFLTDPKMSIDVGAVSKGYAVEQVSKTAAENGFNSGIIDVGGNVRTIGKKGNEFWNIGIQNPDKRSINNSLCTVYISDCSLVTSGIYQRYYTVEGRAYHHIIDPKTLYPSDYFTAVTVSCGNSGIADSLSTAVFNMPISEGEALIDSIPDTCALWVLKDGSIKYSKNFKSILNR